MSAAVKVRPARYCGGVLDGQYARASWQDWIADTSTGCGCEIGGASIAASSGHMGHAEPSQP